MKLIGRIADGSTEIDARMILLRGLERSVVSEELVLIKNGGEKEPVGEIVAVLREGLGRNEFLSASSYRPDVAYMKLGGEPSGAREVYSFAVKPLGILTDGGLEPNRSIIQPRSPVYLLEDGKDDPMKWVSRGIDTLWTEAYLEGHPSWKIPVDRSYLSYHIGIYGSTGSGKSWFTRYILVPLYRKAGFRVLILDWSGSDYAPHTDAAKKIELSDMALDEESLSAYLKDRTSEFGKNNNVEDAFSEFIERWEEEVKEAKVKAEEVKERPEEVLYRELQEWVRGRVESMDDRRWKASALRAYRRAFRTLRPKDLVPIMGSLSIEEVLGRLKELGTLVIDMGGAKAEAKIGFFIALANHLYTIMEEGEDLHMALIIDEAPQYAPWEPKGIQARSSEVIKNLAALGRKRRLSLTLIAQGIRGEIGINAAVRRNLNTHFFGRIHPLDASGEGGASEWLSPYGISADEMLQLKPGRFYFSGAMNPSPVPLLITYDPKGVGKLE